MLRHHLSHDQSPLMLFSLEYGQLAVSFSKQGKADLILSLVNFTL